MGIKILLADDSITIQKVIGIIFGGEEYSLTVVDNGKTAVEKARELNPDVLLIDALMPGMTGYEVCEAVRAIPELATKPILILTGSFEPFDEDKAKKCGADDYLAKPFESQQIVNKVKELAELGSSRLATEAVKPPAAAPEPAPAPAFSAPEETVAVAAPLTAPETPQPSAPADIWGAFTPEVEPPTVAAVAAVPAEAEVSNAFEPDVFAIVNEEDSRIIPSTPAPPESPQHTGTQWVPVEEHTFEFEEESVAELPEAVFAEPPPSVVENSDFGVIAFEDEVPVQIASVAATPEPEPAAAIIAAPVPDLSAFEEPAPAPAPDLSVFEVPTPEPAPAVVEFSEPPVAIPPLAVPAAAVAVPGALSEDQLRAAISAASKEVIERIVWEVVPDLAETLIRDAIRKIREGV